VGPKKLAALILIGLRTTVVGDLKPPIDFIYLYWFKRGAY
jgi:hypothetical protein